MNGAGQCVCIYFVFGICVFITHFLYLCIFVYVMFILGQSVRKTKVERRSVSATEAGVPLLC